MSLNSDRDYNVSHIYKTPKNNQTLAFFKKNFINNKDPRAVKSKSIVIDQDPKIATPTCNTIVTNAPSSYSHIKQNKYDLEITTTGQAVGGPGKKTKVSMWDMMTLYDTHKRKIEEESAFMAHKQ